MVGPILVLISPELASRPTSLYNSRRLQPTNAMLRTRATRLAATLGILAGLWFSSSELDRMLPAEEPMVSDETDMAKRILRRLDSQIAAEVGSHVAPKLGRSIDPKQVDARASEMFRLDQLVRKFQIPPALPRQVRIEVRRGIGQRMVEIDKAHTKELKRWVRRNEWPRRSQFGQPVMDAFWLIAQHADHDREFQRVVLRQIQRRVAEGEAEAWQVAYLFDRIAVGDRRLQRYATQGRCVARNVWNAHPFEKPHLVDKRRAKMGIGPLAEYQRFMSKFCKNFGR